MIEDEPLVLSDKHNTSSKQAKTQPRGPGWGYGLGGSTTQTATDVSDPSWQSLSPPQPLTPYAGAAHGPLHIAAYQDQGGCPMLARSMHIAMTLLVLVPVLLTCGHVQLLRCGAAAADPITS